MFDSIHSNQDRKILSWHSSDYEDEKSHSSKSLGTYKSISNNSKKSKNSQTNNEIFNFIIEYNKFLHTINYNIVEEKEIFE